MRGYSLSRRQWWHLPLAASLCTLCVWARSPIPALPVAVVTVVGRHWRVSLAIVAVACGVGWRSTHQWSSAHLHQVASCSGWARVTEPADSFGRMVVQLGPDRLTVVAHGAGARLASLAVGQRAMVYGTCAATRARRALERHVVGRLQIRAVGTVVPGTSSERLLAHVHDAVQRSADASMPPAVAGLFRGLVIGDDAAEPAWLVAAFRRSGLAHLQAVSGENVAFVLAVFAPLTRRMSAAPRALTVLLVLAGFAVLTGLQPSVLRAVLMAASVAVAAVVGERLDPLANLCWCMMALECVDPFLVWSVGFWLSVGATAGIAALAAPLARRLPLPLWLAVPVSVSAAAQVGTLVPSVVVFGRVPLYGLVANVVAVPVAGIVMLVGLPTAVLVGWWPVTAHSSLASVLLWPSAIGTRWVLDVARLTAQVEPSGGVAVLGWCVVAAVLGRWLWVGRRRVPI